MSVAPGSQSVLVGTAQNFTAAVTNDSQSKGVTWTLSGSGCPGTACGTLSNVTTTSVTYTAPPSVPNPATVTLTATSVSDNTKSGAATITVTSSNPNPVSVTTWRNDNSRSGVNAQESVLTLANVTTKFGKLFSCPVQGFVFAQPLYIANLAIPGKGAHNIVFVATEKDNVYAFDADTNPCVVLWTKNLVPAGDSPLSVTDVPCNVLGPHDVGITGTPVIDPVSQTLYVSVATKNPGGSQFFHRLHALSLLDGAEKFSGPVQIQATLPGTGAGGNGASIFFDTSSGRMQLQRTGLLLANGIVYITWASYCDNMPYHGWVIGYDAANLQFAAAYSPTPNGNDPGGEGGIWMSGAAPSADAGGNIYLSVGNGTFDNTASAVPPVPPKIDFGNSVLRLTKSGTSLAVADFFTPADQAVLNAVDNDLGSSGVVLFSVGSSSMALTAGKNGDLFLLDTASLGGFAKGAGGADAVLQRTNLINPEGFRSTPAFFNNKVYIAGQNSPLFAFSFNAASKKFDVPPSCSTCQQSAETYGQFGASPVISAQATANAIVWVLDAGLSPDTPTVPVILRAYDASNLQNLLYHSDARVGDAAGLAVKFTVPTVANGKVYVGTQTELDVYGLLP